MKIVMQAICMFTGAKLKYFFMGESGTYAFSVSE